MCEKSNATKYKKLPISNFFSFIASVIDIVDCPSLSVISANFHKKAPTVYLEARGKLIHEKNMKSKISRHCPFNGWKPQR